MAMSASGTTRRRTATSCPDRSRRNWSPRPTSWNTTSTAGPWIRAGRATYLERFIHGEIYRLRPDVRAVVHNHSPSVIPFGVTGNPLRPLYHMSAFLAAGVPVFDIRWPPAA